jgi:hypothetical protein
MMGVLVEVAEDDKTDQQEKKMNDSDGCFERGRGLGKVEMMMSEEREEEGWPAQRTQKELKEVMQGEKE